MHVLYFFSIKVWRCTCIFFDLFSSAFKTQEMSYFPLGPPCAAWQSVDMGQQSPSIKLTTGVCTQTSMVYNKWQECHAVFQPHELNQHFYWSQEKSQIQQKWLFKKQSERTWPLPLSLTWCGQVETFGGKIWNVQKRQNCSYSRVLSWLDAVTSPRVSLLPPY